MTAKRPQLENGYFKIANEIAENLAKTNLSPYESRFLWALLRKTYGYNKKEDFIALTQIEEITKMKQPHISRTKKKLLERGIITQTGMKTGFNKNYKEWKEKTYPNRYIPKQVYQHTQTGMKNIPTEGDTKDNKDNIQKTCRFSYKKCKNFFSFYESYPNKKAPRTAHEAWHKAKGIPELKELLVILEKHKQTKQWQEGIIPHPATWLNQGRWEDEVNVQLTEEEKIWKT